MSGYVAEDKRDNSPSGKWERRDDVEGHHGTYGDDETDHDGSILTSGIQEKNLTWQQVRSLPLLR